MTLNLQLVKGCSPLETGLTFSVLGFAAAGAGMAAARLSGKLGLGVTAFSGLALQAVGMPLCAFLPHSGDLTLILTGTAPAGFGDVTGVVMVTVSGTPGVPDHEQGPASALLSTAQQLGAATGVYSAFFLDHDEGAVSFTVQAQGTPYLPGNERLKDSHAMALHRQDADGRQDTVYLAANSGPEPARAGLPAPPPGTDWHLFADTAAADGFPARPPHGEIPLPGRDSLLLAGRSTVVLTARPDKGHPS
ncbi:hypothetical protein [Actinacidiphila sp. ITFR-21]|uniref:hypothetical protein n=1 Tax=Actinacidiphila sp. ITFR-21 TaxID=3075199 RepID=UPI00288C0269|nr:hypothetical protein [Streptomyces sp. ITFR-21]WNI17264.1 hypothetical protein RLT57_18255 [Streptomyces sp. ITFR-21]